MTPEQDSPAMATLSELSEDDLKNLASGLELLVRQSQSAIVAGATLFPLLSKIQQASQVFTKHGTI
jgi:hypothetical protein